MGDVQHTVDERVAEQHIGMSHVDLGTQYQGSGLALTAVHVFEQTEVLFHRTVTVRTVRAGGGGGSLLLGNHFCTLLIHVSPSLLDEPYGKVPELLEIVAGIIHIRPLEPHPLDVTLNTLNILGVLLLGIGIVETQITDTAVLLGNAEVEGNSLGMTDVQITVGLRRETCLNPLSVLAFCQVIYHYLFHEVQTLPDLVIILFDLCHILDGVILPAKVRISERKTKSFWIFPNESTFSEAKGTTNLRENGQTPDDYAKFALILKKICYETY